MKNPEKATVLVEKMLDFAQVHGLMEAEDRCYTRNLLLDALGMAAPEGTVGTEPGELPPTLTPILEELTRMAAEAGVPLRQLPGRGGAGSAGNGRMPAGQQQGRTYGL